MRRESGREQGRGQERWRGKQSGWERVRRKTERRENVTGERNVLIATMQNIVFRKEIF